MFACHEIQLQCQETARTFLKEAFHFGTQAATVMMIGGTCLLCFYQNRSCSLFAASESMIKIGVPAMRILWIGLVFCRIFYYDRYLSTGN